MSNLGNTNSGLKNIFITSAYDDPEPITSFLKAASLDKIRKYKIVNDPSLADIILFVENSRYHSDYFFKKMKSNLFVKKYSHKVFMYNAHDKPWLVLPGLYASMPKNFFNENFIAAVPYVDTINPFIEYDPLISPEFLFSFIGNPNSLPRRNIMKLRHERGVVRFTPGNMFGKGELKNSKLQYAHSLAQSKFILCPKGAGTSSFRIFETMQAGRIPVIISDNWVPPNGPEWSKFALFVAERNIDRIPFILEKEEINWSEKSKLARQEWERFFAPDVIFNYMIDSIMNLKKNNSNINFITHLIHLVPFYKYVFRKLIIENIKATISSFK